MNCTTENNIHPLLLNCPAALEQVGRHFMNEGHSHCDLSKISQKGYQQVGYLALQALQGKEFPKIDWEDDKPLSSHTVHQLTCRFITEVLLHPSRRQSASDEKTPENKHEILPDAWHESTLNVPRNPELLMAFVAARINMFTQEINHLHPSNYPNNPLGHQIVEYLFFARLVGASELKKDLFTICDKLAAGAEKGSLDLAGYLELGTCKSKIDQKIQELVAQSKFP